MYNYWKTILLPFCLIILHLVTNFLLHIKFYYIKNAQSMFLEQKLMFNYKRVNSLLTREKIRKNFHDKVDGWWYGHT